MQRPTTPPATILEWLIARFPGAKMATLRAMVEEKRVTINNAAVKSLKQPLVGTDDVQMHGTSVTPAKAQVLDEGLRVIYQDTDLLVVEKPAGLLTSTDAAEKRPTVIKILSEYVARTNHRNKAQIIHRLDRDASGLLVFARTDAAFHSLKEQFFKHTLTRRYDVLVHGVPKKTEGRLEHILQEDAQTGEVRVTRHARLGKHAILDYQLIAASPDGQAAHLRCTLMTGRKHQIRVQLKAIGHPVLGDRIYGDKFDQEEGGAIHRMALHASVLILEHPRTHNEVRFDSPTPKAFSRVMGH